MADQGKRRARRESVRLDVKVRAGGAFFFTGATKTSAGSGLSSAGGSARGWSELTSSPVGTERSFALPPPPPPLCKFPFDLQLRNDRGVDGPPDDPSPQPQPSPPGSSTSDSSEGTLPLDDVRREQP